MKKVILLGLTLIAGISFSQQEAPTFKRCYSPEYIEYQDQKTPGFAKHVDKQFDIAKQHATLKGNNESEEYTIPVVVHVVHHSGTPNQNIHDSIIENQIDILNHDFGRLNADTVNMRSDFDFVAGRSNIRFRLATIDPNGNPTTGITRTETSKSSFGDISIMMGSLDAIEKVKDSQEGGVDPWDQSRYLNIWVCNMGISFEGIEYTSLLGYATPPTNLPNWPAGGVGNLKDGVVLQFQTVGSNNPNDLSVGAPHEVLGRTATHEIGHYLGLRHIWADGDCSKQDGIDDTPNALDKSEGCDTTANTCVDNIEGIDLPDMVENYMDYSDETCQNTFTKGQVELMEGVLENQRYDLVYNNPASVNTEIMNASIYPNPTTNELNIELNNGIVESFKVYNSRGQVLLTETPKSSLFKVDVSDLTQGVYFINITNKNGMNTVERFIKQ